MTISDVPTQTLPAEGEIGLIDVGSLQLESGAVIDDVCIAVQRWGKLSPARDNVVVGRGWRLVQLPVLHRSRRGRAAGRVRVFQCTVRNADTVELHLKAPLNSRKAPTKTPWGATHV